MADDLDDEWWKETASDDDAGDSAGEDVREAKPVKRSVKRPAGSEEDDQGSEESDVQAPPSKKSKAADSSHSQSPQKPGKKKKKKSQKKFTRKKITEVDEAVLKKGGTPQDVQALLKPIVAVSKSDGSQAQSNDDDDDEDEQQLSLDDDFFDIKQDPDEAAGSYLEQVVPGWQEAVKKAKLAPGSPLMLVICSSAIRAVQLNRELKSFLGKDCKTAKLFAKHMKLEEQKSFLKKKVCHASIGTPNRIQALLESGCLKLSQLHAVVLDWNWRDIKLKRMVDIPDVRRDLTMLLKDHALDHIKHTPCRIAVL